MVGHLFRPKPLKRWWARQGLNLRPHPWEGCALPLSYAPARPVLNLSKDRRQGRAFATAVARWQVSVAAAPAADTPDGLRRPARAKRPPQPGLPANAPPHPPP